MSGLELLIYAAIAAFLLSRLWSVLGQRHDDEPQRPNPLARQAKPDQDEDDGIVLPGRATANLGKEPNPAFTALPAPESLAGGLRKLQETDASFSEKQFLQGAKAAFSMIVTDFARGDLAAVEYLLSPKVTAQFRAAIAERAKDGQTLEHKLLAISDVDITAVRFEGSRVFLTTRFISQQENILIDASGALLSGKRGQAELVEDDWVFSRDTKSPDPNWQVVETRG